MITVQVLLSVVVVSLVSLVGVATLAIDPARLRRLASAFTSFAVGALLGDAFLHLVPATFASASARSAPLDGSIAILAGLLAFFVVDKLLRRRRAHAHASGATSEPRATGEAPVVALNVIGDAIHNALDGLLIGASWLAGPALGTSTTIAVLLHEIPQELGDFGILVHAGLAPRRAVLLNLASASAAILGAVAALLVASVARESLVGVLVPATAGGFVYIAAANLIPDLQRESAPRSLVSQTAWIAAGMAVMALLRGLDP